MPTYDYACECGATMEIIKGFSDTIQQEYECSCGGTMRRVYAAPAIKFNGSGFYSTDN